MADNIEEIEPKKSRKKPSRTAKKEEVLIASKTLGEIAKDALDEELDFTTSEELTKESEVKREEELIASIGLNDSPEVLQLKSEVVGLSKSAENWKRFLADKKLTPEEFLVKYPTNKMKHFIQEIIDFNKKTGKFSI